MKGAGFFLPWLGVVDAGGPVLCRLGGAGVAGAYAPQGDGCADGYPCPPEAAVGEGCDGEADSEGQEDSAEESAVPDVHWVLSFIR